MANMERADTTLIGPTIERIVPLDRAAMEAAQSRLDRLTKPQGSLGWLEELAVWLAGATEDPTPLLPRKTVVVAAADHGVAAGGVSAYPQAVTVAMVQNFLAGGAAINVMARAQGATVTVVDAGVASVIEPPAGTSSLRFQSRRVGAGTADIRSGPAMSAEQAEQAVAHGMEVVAGLRESGVDIVATGDMGIGNTTASAAITSLWAEASVEEVTGRGTGIDEAGWQRKVAAVRDALEANRPDLSDGLDILQKIGGFEIGVLAGVILGAAAERVPVVLDGFVSGAAAQIAQAIAPQSIEYCVAAHVSAEPGHAIALERLGLTPYMDLEMRLGEGTGAVLFFGHVEAATRVLSEMATFDEAGVPERDDS